MAEMKNLTINGTQFTLPFAPAGYGLGDQAKFLTSADDLNTIYQSGWYHWGSSIPKNVPVIKYDGGYGFMRVDGANDLNFVQTVWSKYSDAKNLSVTRAVINGVTDEFEWNNPPMLLGVEYRTTERWAGKAVYTKLLNVASAGVGTTTIQHGIAMTQCLECKACESGNDTLPMKYAYGTTDIVKNAYANSTQILVYSDSAITNVHCTLKYTKD